MKSPVEKAYERHDKWLGIVKSFGGIKDTEAEDLCQELYFILIRNTQRGINFNYGEDINYYYCYKILRGLHIDLVRKNNSFRFSPKNKKWKNYEKNFEDLGSRRRN